MLQPIIYCPDCGRVMTMTKTEHEGNFAYAHFSCTCGTLGKKECSMVTVGPFIRDGEKTPTPLGGV